MYYSVHCMIWMRIVYWTIQWGTRKAYGKNSYREFLPVSYA